MKIILGLVLSALVFVAISIFVFPSQIKLFIHETLITKIYNIPFVGSELALSKSTNVKQQRKHEGLMHYVIDNFTDYSIEIYDLPFPSYFAWRDKPTAYLEQTKDKIIIASGGGDFIFAEKEGINNKNISFKPIESNITSLIEDDLFYRLGTSSIKDLKVIDNFLYFSYTKKVSEECYNVSVLRSEISFSNLFFKEIFSPNECINHEHKKQNGGRIFPYKDGQLLLSVGSMSNNKEAQKIDSIFGKIISFTPMSNEYEILSMGHRNPQGLYYDNLNDVIINTEHGALGADEINVNLIPNPTDIKNYGWPISSYSSHYGRIEKEDEPLHNSHSDYGFIEPSKYFTPALGISQIIAAPKDLSFNNSIDYFVSSMGHGLSEGGDMSIYHIRFDENYGNLVVSDIIPIGERIRDLELLQDSDTILLILESIPAFAVLNKKNYLCDKNELPCHYEKKFIKSHPTDPLSVIRETYENLLP